MGLDMHLTGKKYYWSTFGNLVNDRHEDDFPVEEVHVRLGYWRKHPDLHGYIVQTFGGGVDECQDIDLDLGQLSQLYIAVKERALPKTTGFFFGESDEGDRQPTLDILDRAMAWLKAGRRSPFETVEVETAGIAELQMHVQEVKMAPPVEGQDVTRYVVYRASW